MRLLKGLILADISLFTLAGCGGGGGGDTGTNADPQGIWSGPTSTGYIANTVILETGETWGIYSSGNTIYGGLYGTATTNGNTVSISGTDFNFIKNQTAQGSLSGPIVAKSTMTISGSGVTTQLTYNPTYDATASPVTGSWAFNGRSSTYALAPATVTINNTGGFVLNQTNCSTTGNLTQRATGKNIYNINLTSVGIGCAIGQSSISGVAYIDTTTNPNRMLILALTSTKNDGLVIIATRQS